MAAAVRARECGKPVTVLDDNPAAGGQIWRGGHGSKWFEKFRKSAAILLTGRRVISGDAARRTLLVESAGGAAEIPYETLILTTGARELFLPFPGWTLPNVMGVGGLQALGKSGLPVKGKRVVVAGSGPLLLAVAHYLRKRGAAVPVVAEQASWGDLVKFTAHLTPGKMLQAAALQTLAYQAGTWVTKAEGSERVERVMLSTGKSVECDYLAVAYGFVPNNELALHLGQSDAILAAGECTGIGGVELSVIEGEIAGYTAAGRPELAEKLFPARHTARRFARALNETFSPRAELKELCERETIVCRCEDVTRGRLEDAESWREAKLHFRCGMGPCQGRVCGPAVQFLFGWQAESVRPPVFPARISSLITAKEEL
jgi:NADPH-dependent 2,4-dienoyl-CoA reductase/sulfur reductase-like enzyme